MSTVLVVEDSFTQREVIGKLLETIGIKLIFAVNGVEALSLVESHCPKVVILDIVMPQMNGYEVCRRLKGSNFTHNPAIVMYSTKSEQCDLYWGSKLGADAYVSKLCHPQVLVNTVEHLLRKASPVHESFRVSMAKQQSTLIAKIKRLYSELRVYKKALRQSTAYLEFQELTKIIEQLEAEIDFLEAQLYAYTWR